MIFNPDTMKLLVKQDMYLSFVFNDLMDKHNDEEFVLKVLFNSIYEAEYQKINQLFVLLE